MSVRNNYSLFGTIINQIKSSFKRNRHSNNSIAFDMINEQMNTINEMMYSVLSNYISEVHIIHRNKYGDEYNRIETYSMGNEIVYPTLGISSEFIIDLLMEMIDWNTIKTSLPKNTRFFYVEFKTTHGDVFYMNRLMNNRIYKK